MVRAALFLSAFVPLGCSGIEDDLSPSPADAGCDADPFDLGSMTDDVAYLASPELDGRVPGTEGDELARAFVDHRFACLGLDSLLPDEGYEEPFTDSLDRETANVLAVLPGTDPSLDSEVILVSAHIDHLGDGLLGANDNASGVSALLAIAAAMANDAPPSRAVIFAAFGSEESGFEGSEVFYTDSVSRLPPADVVFNLNMDMVGSYDQLGIVHALGTIEGTPGREVIDLLAPDYPSLEVAVGDTSDESDNVTFSSRGVPYIFLWTEDPECYHEACDRSERIDFAHLSEIARLASDVVATLASTDEDLADAVEGRRPRSS